MADSILKIKDLCVDYITEEVVIKALDSVDLEIGHSEILGVVGESGSGKSTLGLSVMGILPEEGRISRGSIILEEENLVQLSASRYRRLRGSQISMIFQEPMDALNPVYTVGYQIKEASRQLGMDSKREDILELLHMVNMSDPERVISDYPHQLSAGMRQRAMIAMSLCGKPKLLIADEPTSSLDVTVQILILDLLLELKDKMHLSILFISHDLSLIEHIADRVAILYKGKIQEVGSKEDILYSPGAEYTRELIGSMDFLNKVKNES